MMLPRLSEMLAMMPLLFVPAWYKETMKMSEPIVYRCDRENCPRNKLIHCYVVKLSCPPEADIIVLHKCEATKQDISVTIKAPA